jgi:twinkle protein
MSDKDFSDFGISIPYGRRGEVDTTCPTCSPTRKKKSDKCLSVNTDDGTWFCQHCGWKGSLGRKTDWRDQMQTVRVHDLPKAPPAEEHVLPNEVLAWFAHRGIPDWVLSDAGITSGKEFSPAQNAEVTAIRFPYFRDHTLVNIKFRSHPKQFWMSKGAERILYGYDDVVGQEEICIVEGEMDKLSIDAVQGPATCSVPDGAPSPEAANYANKFSFLESSEEIFTQAKRVILACDMDAPGKKLTDELARRIGFAKCFRVTWPDGCKDANETLVKLGSGAVCAALADAQPYPVDGIITVRDLHDASDALYESGFDRGLEINWPQWDTLCRAKAGLFTMVTGSPGSGKSHFVDNICVRLAKFHDWRFGICSPENQPLARHLAGIMSIAAEKPFTRGPIERMDPEEMKRTRAWVDQHFTFVLPEEPTVDRILELADVLVYRHGIKGLVIDPWNELDHTRPGNMTETEWVSRSISTLRNWARQRVVGIWLVAHPTKLQKDKDGNYPVPTMYDISGSAHFNNKADAGFSVWRNPLSNSPEVHVQKVRFQETGELGVAGFWFDKATGRFVESR